MILIFGASKGIGKAICEHLLDKQIEVLGISRNIENLSYPTYQCDISNADAIKKLLKHLKKENIQVDGLINCAGIASMNLTITMPTDTSKNIVETNLLGTILISQLLTPLMIKNKTGFIINFSTIAVALGLAGEAVYIASKAGVEAFSRVFAKEVSSFGIRVNCIAPGPIDTQLIHGISKDKIKAIINSQVITKQFTTNDICNLIDFLISNEADSISGQVINIGGV